MAQLKLLHVATDAQHMYARTRAHTHTHTHTQKHTCMHARMHSHTHTHTHTLPLFSLLQLHYGGEDAYFISEIGAMGVADGVGGWQETGVNPAGD